MNRRLEGNLPPATALVATPGHPWTDALGSLRLPTHHARPNWHERAAAIQHALKTLR
jgi:hypothetical protein